ncbi:nitroreductase family protein [Hydrogenimonas urashimensis]|uniref:nitroreductase family protein n=1 Tax=Hydrogenimonas urashimensis TaxID=2740515 RepID=UPI0019168182|nr:nitroreductase family protein [Hydrogenimonas urashimensis]
MNNCLGREYHESTKHSWLSVRQHPNRLDWENRPSPMKSYPRRYPRIRLEKECPAHIFIYHIGGITAKKSYPGVEYYLRTVPSAGALYPNELYFQARGVEGFKDGIYHFEVGSSSAVLLRSIGKDEGLEPFLRLRHPMRGLLFFISSPWYRSAWKYKDRAFRYTLLDAGHLLGAIEAGSYLYKHAYRITYAADLEGLNRFFGFREREFFLSSAIAAVPDTQGEAVVPDSGIEQVDPVGAFEASPLIERAYRETMTLHGCRKEPGFPRFAFHKEAWREVIVKRRSARAFSAGKGVTRAQFQMLAEILEQPIPSDCDEPVEIYAVLNRSTDMPIGIYSGKKLIREGDFAKKAAYLCLEQSFVADSAITFFLLSGGCNYRALCQKAGLLGHRVYLASGYLGLGCSGIGAYYDDEVADWLGRKDAMVLYALAVGPEER